MPFLCIFMFKHQGYLINVATNVQFVLNWTISSSLPFNLTVYRHFEDDKYKIENAHCNEHQMLLI